MKNKIIDRLAKDTIAVELSGHGFFCTSIGAVSMRADYTQRVLAKLIAEAYGGGCGEASTKSYWLRFPKTVLLVVYGGLVDPATATPEASPVTSIESQVYIDGGWPALRAYRQLPLRCPDCGDVVVKHHADEPHYCDTCDREVETPVACETTAEAQQHGKRG